MASFFAVAVGRKQGIFFSWQECAKYVNGFPGSFFQSFDTFEDAEAFIAEHGASRPSKKQKTSPNTNIQHSPLKHETKQSVRKITSFFDLTSSTPPTIPKNEPIDLCDIKDSIILREEAEFIPQTFKKESTKRKPKVEPQTKKQTMKPIKKVKKITKSIPTATKVDATVLSLGEDQKRAYEAVIKEKKSVFLTGSAGTGKSHLLRVIIAELKKNHGRSSVAVCASTGIAALQIKGRTLHSFAGIGLGTLPFNLLLQRAYGKKKSWRKCKVLIIDEISMISGKLLDIIENISRIIRENNRPFGGIQVVICGDFFQLPPVQMKELFAFQSEAWKNTIQQTFELTHVYRQKDAAFVGHLNEIRHGICSPQSVLFFQQASRPLPFHDGIIATKLHCTNNSVDGENNYQLAQIQEDELVYSCLERKKDSLVCKHIDEVFTLIKASQKSCISPKKLTLKVGAQVMLTRNKGGGDIDLDLVNGSRGVVTGFVLTDVAHIQLDILKWESKVVDMNSVSLWMEHQQKFAMANRENYTFDEHGKLAQIAFPVVRFANGMVVNPVTPVAWNVSFKKEEFWYRIQIPLRLSWAVTIHKSQGLTLDRASLDLSRVFAHGQAYVALSRVLSIDGLELSGFSAKAVTAHPDVLRYYAEKCNDPIAKKIVSNMKEFGIHTTIEDLVSEIRGS